MKKPSTPQWTFAAVGATSVWAEDLGDYVAVDLQTRVHVWIFALHTTTDQKRYDALDVDSWEFRVLAHRRLLATGQKSARLSTLDRKWGLKPVAYAQLADAVAEARRDNDTFTPR